MITPTAPHPLRAAQHQLALLSLLIALVALLLYRAARSVDRGRRQVLGAYGRLAEQYDELARDTLKLTTERDSWMRLSPAEQVRTLAELSDVIAERAERVELTADRTDPALDHDAEPGDPPLPPVAVAPEPEFEPDPGTLDTCPGSCDSPVACQAEGHCRRQLPEPTIDPAGDQLADDPDPAGALAEADALAAEHSGHAPGYTSGDDA
jgi:hypothetical protein